MQEQNRLNIHTDFLKGTQISLLVILSLTGPLFKLMSNVDICMWCMTLEDPVAEI